MIPMGMTGKKIKEFFSKLHCSSEDKFVKESLPMNGIRGLIQITLNADQKEKLRVKKNINIPGFKR